VSAVNTVACFADRWILPGLHATLASLLAHARDTAPLRILVFGERLTRHEQAMLHATARSFPGAHQFEIREFVTPVTRRLRSLRGNYTTYGRLFLPDLVPDAATCVYLDCDLIVARPLDDLFALTRSGEALYAEGTGVRRDSLDGPTFTSLSLDLSAVYFNCGVLVLNLDRWRRETLTERCLDFADKHSRLLLSADQTVLNAVLNDDCGKFGAEYNTLLWPSEPELAPAERNHRIFHFVGAPKPWDRLGRFANRNFPLWHQWAVKTAWYADWRSRLVDQAGIERSLRVGPATLRELRNRYTRRARAIALGKPS
jgi:lipopolysaccharide biosynthesis glycosyltransferase